MIKPYVSIFFAIIFTAVVSWPLLPGVFSQGTNSLSDLPTQASGIVFSNRSRIPETISNFAAQVEKIERVLSYRTEEILTEELFVGESEVVQNGVDGVHVEEYEVYSWGGGEFARDLITVEVQEPVDEIIKLGTRKNIRKLTTPDGEIEYYQKIVMWAMSYDGNCRGCSGRTYLGTSVRHGVCAVDPGVIPLGSRVYVLGYGICRAEDIGGAVQGNMIDLGFEDVSSGWWSSRYVDVYLMD